MVVALELILNERRRRNGINRTSNWHDRNSSILYEIKEKARDKYKLKATNSNMTVTQLEYDSNIISIQLKHNQNMTVTLDPD